MGNEAECTLKLGSRKSKGTALLETAELIFRPSNGGARVKIAFSSIKSAKAAHGELRLDTENGTAVLSLGPASQKWCDKILQPKTRAQKLGWKPGSSVSLLGEFDKGFLRELRGATLKISHGKIDAASEFIFLSAQSRAELAAGIGKAAKSMKGATVLWIVYPKGQKGITENDVLSSGRRAGLKDVKVVGFSVTHTALKFVVPVADR
jgi:hypothetical protein